MALGGGIALTRMTELAGSSGSGKTSLILSTFIEAQKQFPDKSVVFIDAEHALDTEWAGKLGIDFDRFEHIQPEFAEEALGVMEAYLKSGKVSAIALDSVPALITEKEMEGDIGDANIGIQSRLVAQEMKRIGSLGFRENVAIIYINQKRASLASGGSMGGPEPTKFTGGMALPFYMTTRLQMARIGSTYADAEKKEINGQEVEVRVLKNKIGAGPGRRVTFFIDNSVGVDKAQEVLDIAIEAGKVKAAGSWFTFETTGEKVQGSNKAKAIIRQTYLEDWTKQIRNGEW